MYQKHLNKGMGTQWSQDEVEKKKVPDRLPSQLINPKYFASLRHNLCWLLAGVDLGHNNHHFHSRVEGLTEHPVEVVVGLDDFLLGVACVPAESTPQSKVVITKRRDTEKGENERVTSCGTGF